MNLFFKNIKGALELYCVKWDFLTVGSERSQKNVFLCKAKELQLFIVEIVDHSIHRGSHSIQYIPVYL